jgi:hypothetical protein
MQHEELTGSSKNAAEGAASSIHDNETTHADFQQNLLEQKATSKFMGMDVMNRDTDNELNEITHGREEMTSARFGSGSAGAPEIAVQHKHRSDDGPAEEEFAVLTNALVSEDSMSALLDSVNNVLATTRPEEAHADA